jgi:hypothetical protein
MSASFAASVTLIFSPPGYESDKYIRNEGTIIEREREGELEMDVEKAGERGQKRDCIKYRNR